MKPSSSVSTNNTVTHNSFRPASDLPQKWPINTQPRLRSTAAHSHSIQPCHPAFHATFSVSYGRWEHYIYLSTLSASCSPPTSCLHGCGTIGTGRKAVVSFICVRAFDWKRDRVKVKEELMPLIFPAVTWGRTQEKKKKKQGRGWCIMQKVLWSLWATTTLCKPPPPSCSSSSISISDNVQCMCVPFFPSSQTTRFSEKQLGKMSENARKNLNSWQHDCMPLQKEGGRNALKK